MLVIRRVLWYTIFNIYLPEAFQMSGYIGTRCMVCSEKFTSEDDVVVCPECGTPYHRECWQKEGKCVNTALHDCGGSWKPSYDTGRDGSESEAVVCRFCGNTNPPLTLFCRRCGMPVSTIQNESDKTAQTFSGMNINDDPNAYNRNANGGMGGVQMNPFLINYSDPLCGFSPDEDFDGVKMSELGDYVGTNTHYYLPIFKRFKETNRGISWNFCAMLFPELYFSYRKMPLIALAAFIVRTVSQIPQYIALLSQLGGFGVFSDMAASINITSGAFRGVLMIGYVLFYTLMFTTGLFGNKLYFDSAVRKIKKIKSRETSPDSTVLRAKIVKKGGTSALWLVLFICLMALPSIILWFGQYTAMFGKI